MWYFQVRFMYGSRQFPTSFPLSCTTLSAPTSPLPLSPPPSPSPLLSLCPGEGQFSRSSKRYRFCARTLRILTCHTFPSISVYILFLICPLSLRGISSHYVLQFGWELQVIRIFSFSLYLHNISFYPPSSLNISFMLHILPYRGVCR